MDGIRALCRRCGQSGETKDMTKIDTDHYCYLCLDMDTIDEGWAQ